jgi:hypothetical protein
MGRNIRKMVVELVHRNKMVELVHRNKVLEVIDSRKAMVASSSCMDSLAPPK